MTNVYLFLADQSFRGELKGQLSLNIQKKKLPKSGRRPFNQALLYTVNLAGVLLLWCPALF